MKFRYFTKSRENKKIKYTRESTHSGLQESSKLFLFHTRQIQGLEFVQIRKLKVLKDIEKTIQHDKFNSFKKHNNSDNKKTYLKQNIKNKKLDEIRFLNVIDSVIVAISVNKLKKER